MTKISDMKIKSNDNVEYTIQVTEDAVTLNDDQIASIQSMIEAAESHEIEKDGVTIKNLPFDQSEEVINYLGDIIGDLNEAELIEDEIIDLTAHASERISDREICIDRRWTHGSAEYEIAECLKRAYSVEQIRLRFNPDTLVSWERLAFKIKGSIGRREKRRDGELVIYFDQDPLEKEDVVMVITILQPEY